MKRGSFPSRIFRKVFATAPAHCHLVHFHVSLPILSTANLVSFTTVAKVKLLQETTVSISPPCVELIKRPWRCERRAEQFLTGVYEAPSKVDQSNVQVMAHDKVLGTEIEMDNVALVKKAQHVRHLCCPKHEKFLESFSDLFILFVLDRAVEEIYQMIFNEPMSASIGYPSSPSRSSKIHETPQSVAIAITNGHSPVIQRSKVAPGEVLGRSLQSPP